MYVDVKDTTFPIKLKLEGENISKMFQKYLHSCAKHNTALVIGARHDMNIQR